LALSKLFDLEKRPAFYACSLTARPAGFICGLYDATTLVNSVLEHQLPESFSVIIKADARQIIVPAGSTLTTNTADGPGTPLQMANVTWFISLNPVNKNALGFGRIV